MGTTIALTNHKGGCGKTTSSINLGAALALQGHRTLIVDLDPQQNLTQSLGYDPYSTECKWDVYTCLEFNRPLQPINVSEKLDMVPTKRDLAGMELELSNRERTQVAKLLEPIKGHYDYIVLDCPPALGMLTINAMVAADAIYIPLQSQYLALQGIDNIREMAEDVRQHLNPKLKLAGVFLTQYDSRKVLHRNVDKLAEVMLDGLLCKTKVRDNVALAEAPALGQTIYQYAPKSKGAADYTALAKEVHGTLAKK